MQLIRYQLIWAICLVGILTGNFAWADKAIESNMEDNVTAKSVEAVAEGNTAFAIELYAQLTKAKNDNLFFSPYSISTALAMTYIGAKGKTATQMAQVLNFPDSKTKLHPIFFRLQKQVNDAAHDDIELKVANAIWSQQKHSFVKDFKDSLQKYYQANLQKADFKTAHEPVRQKINAWVEKQTNDKIKNLIKKGVLNRLTRMVLVNAIYFKGNWVTPFDSSDTKNTPFWTTAADSVEVPMMNQKHWFGYMENTDLQLLELPYDAANNSEAGNDLSMLVLLPRERDGLAKLEKLLNPQNLAKWLLSLRHQKVKVFLPKFKINTGFELSKTLTSMGMPNAFGNKADFSGMDGTKNLYLTSVVHQAFVDVNEKGTEAAAATGVIVGTRSIAPPSPTFRADHPFIFLIRHNLSGSILFIGRIVNPTK